MFFKKFAALLLIPIALTGCDEEIQIDIPDLDNQPYREFFETQLDPAKICSDVTVAKSNGGVIKGTRDCKLPTNLCKVAGSTDCYLTDPNLYGLDPKHLVPENFRKGVAVAEVTGSLIADDSFCAGDGENACVATPRFSSVSKTGAVAKVPVGQSIASLPGEFEPDFPDVANVLSSAKTAGRSGTLPSCTSSGSSNCVLSTSFRAVAPSALRPADIRAGAKIAAVTGNFKTSLPECTASNKTNCIATSRFVAVERARIVGGNLETGYSVLGVNGSVRPKPAACTADNQTGCVATDPMKAINKAALNAGQIRSGVVIAGIRGAFPSAAHPLAGGDSAVPDLTSGTFIASLKKNDSFEVWDSAGKRHLLQGSANLKPDRILKGRSIFGVAGNVDTKPEECTTDGQAGCVTTAAFPALKKSLLSPAIVRSGVQIAGVTGAYPSAAHPLANNTVLADLNFPADLANAAEVEFFDATGAVHKVRGSADLVAPRILSGVNLFDVAGSAAASPANCDRHDQQDCVASAGHPAYKKADLSANVLKKGTTISGVAGNFPSTASPLIGASGATDLTSGNFAATIGSAGSFEFWDATGQRHTLSGDAQLAPANILSGVSIFGKAGTMKDLPPACSLATRGCLTTATHPSYSRLALTEGLIKDGVKIGEVTGKYPSASYRLPGAETAITDLTAGNFNSRMASAVGFEYWDATGRRFTAQGDSSLVAGNIRQGQSIFGVTGSAAASPALCSSENAANCVTSAGFPAYEKSKLSAANIKNGVKLLGVTGTYPSATNRLETATATTDLSSGNFDARMRDGGSFEYWTSAGTRQTGNGSTALIPDNLTQGTTIYGVSGTIAPTPATCTAGNQNGCMATASFPAFQRSTLKPEFLKKDVELYGVTGQYPSATFPLVGNTSTTDLTSGNFTSRHQSSALYEFFDSAGGVHQGRGDDNLQAGNIDTGVNILGVTGTFLGMHPDREWDFLAGNSVGGVNGKVKTNCRNLTHSGSTGNYLAVDDQKQEGSKIPSNNPWTSPLSSCANEVFLDVSINEATDRATTCDATNSNVVCMHKDRITGLTWRAAPRNNTAYSWGEANDACRALNTGGHSDWRLPTVYEAFKAGVHGMHQLKVTFNTGIESQEVYRTNYPVWTSTPASGGKMNMVWMSQGRLSVPPDGHAGTIYHCVR